jgi:hypothetical protein
MVRAWGIGCRCHPAIGVVTGSCALLPVDLLCVLPRAAISVAGPGFVLDVAGLVGDRRVCGVGLRLVVPFGRVLAVEVNWSGSRHRATGPNGLRAARADPNKPTAPRAAAVRWLS